MKRKNGRKKKLEYTHTIQVNSIDIIYYIGKYITIYKYTMKGMKEVFEKILFS